MKRLLLQFITAFCIVSLIIPNSLWAAYTCTATSAGNFSNTAIWSNCNSTYPRADDTIDFGGYTVIWDASAGATIPATGTFALIRSGTTNNSAGFLTLDLSGATCHSGCSLSATTIQAGTVPIVTIAGTTDHVLTITSGLHSASAGIIAGTASAATGVETTSTGTVIINGDITGSAANAASGVYNSGTGIVTVGTGYVITGGGANAANGIINGSTGTVNIGNDCTMTGGSIAGAYGGDNASTGAWTFGTGVTIQSGAAAGFLNLSTGSVTVGANSTIVATGAGYGFHNETTGAVTIENGCTIQGGTQNGFYNKSTGQVTLGTGCSLIYGTTKPAYTGSSPAWAASVTNKLKYYQGAGFGQAANTDFSTSSGGGGGAFAY